MSKGKGSGGVVQWGCCVMGVLCNGGVVQWECCAMGVLCDGQHTLCDCVYVGRGSCMIVCPRIAGRILSRLRIQTDSPCTSSVRLKMS